MHCEVLIVKFAEQFLFLSLSPGLASLLDLPVTYLLITMDQITAVAVLQSCNPYVGGRLQQNADQRGPSTVLNLGHHRRAGTNG